MGFLYYSGHGAADAETKRNYLIPIDAKKPGTESFWDESVQLDEVLSLLNGASGAAKFVVFDACRNELRLPYRGSKGFEPVREQPGSYVAYTTAPGQPALDDGATSGPYAAALAAELAKPGLDHLTLFQDVKEAVYLATKGAQQPWATDGLVRRIYLTGKPKPALSNPSPEKPDEAAQAWSVIQNTSSEAVLDEFIRRYVNSFYASFAKARLQELRAAGQAVNVPKLNPIEAEPQEQACSDGLLVSVAMSSEKPCIKPGSGKSFKDCPDCPEMVVVPPGSFMMGSPENEPERQNLQVGTETPQHKVSIAEAFAVGRFHITRGEFARFAKTTGYNTTGGCYSLTGSEWRNNRTASWQSPGFPQDDTHPVVCVNWEDIKAYVAWLAEQTGKNYRLLSEAEYEYAARAGSTTPFWWGATISPDLANYNGNNAYAGGLKGSYRAETVSVQSFSPNPWGLYHVSGNAWTWTKDCWHDNYLGAPSDGSAWMTGECRSRVIRGGSWNSPPASLRGASRTWIDPGTRGNSNGFRVARPLNP